MVFSEKLSFFKKNDKKTDNAMGFLSLLANFDKLPSVFKYINQIAMQIFTMSLLSRIELLLNTNN